MNKVSSPLAAFCTNLKKMELGTWFLLVVKLIDRELNPWPGVVVIEFDVKNGVDGDAASKTSTTYVIGPLFTRVESCQEKNGNSKVSNQGWETA